MAYTKEGLDRSKQKEMVEIFHSFEWLIKEKLISLDNMIRAMQDEMMSCYIPKRMNQDFITTEFNRVWQEVIEEQSQKYNNDELRKGRLA